MRALVCTKPGALDYITLDTPALQPGQAVIRIRNIGICGTDLHAYEGTQPYFTYPRILGHELSGELIAADNAPEFKPGERVTFIPYFSCGRCLACRTGKPNCCVQIQVFGVHVDGGMMEYVTVPSQSLVKGNGLDYPELALVESLAIGAHGIRRAGMQKGEFVLVIGAGPIGMGTMAFAGIEGANVIAMDINESRLSFCKNKLKVMHAIHARDNDVMEQLAEITGGDMPSVVIDATGNQKAINNAINFLAHSGRYILIGLQKNDLVFSHPEFHKRETTLMSSRNATRADFDHVIACIKSGLIKPADYITDHVRFSEVQDQFPHWLDPSGNRIKVIAEMD